MSHTVKYPQITEKTVDKMDFQNKMVFICDSGAEKDEIVDVIESRYDVTIDGINTMVTTSGEKKAEVQLTDDYDAQEIASRIGVF